MPRFDLPWALFASLTLTVGAVLAFWGWQRRRLSRLRQLGGDAAVRRLAPPEVRRAPRARGLRVTAALACASLAFAGPRWGEGTTSTRSEGIDVVLALDASLSMLATDERPSRLERMKQEVRRFRATSQGDRIALLAFAGRSYILTPLTADDGAIELFLDNLDPSIVGQAGTALAPTLIQGVDLLRAARGAAGRALVVLTDGEAFDDPAESLTAARAARDADIAVVTVGFGTEGGSTIPIREGGGTASKRDERGQVVITRYDPTLLRAVAKAAGGEFIAAGESDKGTRIRQALARVEARQRDVAEGLSRPLRISWLLLPAVLLLLFDALRADGATFRRARRWLRLAAPLALLVTQANRAQAQVERDPMAQFRLGHFLRAAQLWRSQIANGDQRPTTLYNYGAALLAADSLDTAAEVLEHAALSPDPAVRSLALYNLGLAQLRRGSAGDARALEGSLNAYRALLRQQPDDAEAKWNYELALRVRKQQSGGGGRNEKQNEQQQQAQRPQQEDASSMSRQQAEQLLSSAARDERESQAKRQRGTRQERPVGGKDW